MGRRRSTSCLKIIACGAEHDDGEVSENKSSRGWSFRKRSERHRVLSSTAIAETPGHKEIPVSDGLNLQPPVCSAVPEKTSTVKYIEEKPQSLAPVPVQESESIATVTNESDKDVNLEESVVIIQTAIRGFLAQRDVVKRKNVVKLQAAVRGHLVRKQAVGALRCVQAIVKMQALVRARRARQSLEGSYTEKKLDGKHETDSLNLKQEKSATKPNVTYTSLEKLLSNRFACQLMESTPKTKTINIKCDPLKPNSAWNWLERWMSVSVTEQSPKLEVVNNQPETEKNEDFASPVDVRAPSEAYSESSGLKSGVRETIVPSESEENLITYDAEKVKFEASQPTPFGTDNLQHCPLENTSTSGQKEASVGTNSRETSVEISSKRNQTILSDANSKAEASYPPCELETEHQQPKRSMKRFASDQHETAEKKRVFGSRKASNPAFIVAQTKLEELSSAANPGRSINSSYQDVGVGPNLDTVSSGADTDSRKKEASTIEPLVHNNSGVHHGGSECGTELSISSTLDSPDISEVGATGCEQGAKPLEQENCSSNATKDLDNKSYNASTIPLSNASMSVTDQTEKIDGMSKYGNSDEAVDSPQVEQDPKTTTCDPQRELDPEMCQQASPEGSPRIHMTILESQGTPPSKVSVKGKKSKPDKSNQKRKSLSADRSPANDSSARGSMEQLPKDQKSGKRRNSLGSTKLENIDQEQRDSSSNSLPRFMQATESARAKVHTNNSPRSSPDLHDRDIYIKKRHSLPGVNERQGSPRIQQSMSQAQQGAKGNGTPPLHERKWQR
ncbi:hypothetical protein SLE2022_216910 [Rubroshorea leprosula]